MSPILAYTPFVEPLTEMSQGVVDVWWLTLPVLAFLTAVAYKAVRLPTLDGYFRAVVVMALQITCAMVGIAIALAVIAELIVPFFQG